MSYSCFFRAEFPATQDDKVQIEKEGNNILHEFLTFWSASGGKKKYFFCCIITFTTQVHTDIHHKHDTIRRLRLLIQMEEGCFSPSGKPKMKEATPIGGRSRNPYKAEEKCA